MNLPTLAQASGPAQPPGNSIVGVASNALECLAVGPNTPAPASGVVNLTWQGEAESARLIVQVAGAEAAHTIKINGQAVAQVPVHPGGQLCSDGEDTESFYLDVPLDVLVQGDNSIEITHDALAGDSWSAAYVRLEVQGRFVVNMPGSPGQIGSADISTLATPFTINITNSYDGSSQQARVQIPDSYNAGVATPLLVAIHPRSSDMFFGEDKFGAAANTKGWLLASPELHGSWPGDLANPIPDPPGKYSYASLEGQYDIVATVKYMLQNYNVDRDRIYIVGYSMGAQMATLMAAKYPDVFAALFDNKGPTDWVDWYNESVALGNQGFHTGWMRRECYQVINNVNTLRNPTQNPFCYQRRSSLNYASNYVRKLNFASIYSRMPISLTHTVSDALVQIHHSRDLRDAINSYNPSLLVSLFEENSGDPAIDGGSPFFHDYEPDPTTVLNFLEPFTLDNNPTSLDLTSDESKSFYWLRIVKSNAEQFSRVKVNVVGQTVTAVISDTTTTQLGFNLGSGSITEIIPQPGLGLPTGVYEVQGGGNNVDVSYNTGYLTVNVSSTTTPYTVTISLIPGSAPSVFTYLPLVLK
ncbi:MAG: prolyl oligopeptidase family serine peptidase [Anaerolineae bacterium]|nr:prolyl oligopeptidase family serine peptidase [Anaerolineae bacterium]